MKLDDKCFFYHTGKEKRIVGIVKVVKEAFFDKTDKTQKFVSIIVKSVSPLKREVSLQEIKKNKDFKDFSLIKQSRLSVMEVDLIYWKKICKMGTKRWELNIQMLINYTLDSATPEGRNLRFRYSSVG